MKTYFNLYLSENNYNTLLVKCKKMNISIEDFFIQRIHSDNVLCLQTNYFHLLAESLKIYLALNDPAWDTAKVLKSLSFLNSTFKNIVTKTKFNSHMRNLNKLDLVEHFIRITLTDHDYNKLLEKCDKAQITPLNFLYRCICEDNMVVDVDTEDLHTGITLYNEALHNSSVENLKTIHCEIDKQCDYLDSLLKKITANKHNTANTTEVKKS